MLADPICYCDRPERRSLDLRPSGADCIPLLSMTRLKSVAQAPAQHIHPGCLEIVLCLRGIVAFEAGALRYPFLPGSIFVSTERQPHALEANPRGLTTYSVLFAPPPDGATVLGLDPHESDWLVRSLCHLPRRCFRDATQVKACFRRLFEIHDGTQAGSVARRLKTKSAVIDLLLAVIESARARDLAIPSQIAAIAARIAASPEADYALEDLAREAGLAPVTFSTRFKQATGLPPHAYVLNERIRRARALLTETDCPIRVISDQLRFSSPQHFTTAFRTTVGEPPAAYRDHARP